MREICFAEAAAKALSETLEGMAFVEIISDAESPEAVRDRCAWVWSAVDIKEPFQGEFVLIFPKHVANAITLSVYGEFGETAAEDKVSDTLRELANTTAGKFLGTVVAEDRSFSFSLPRSGNGWPDLSGKECCGFLTDEEDHIFVALRSAQ